MKRIIQITGLCALLLLLSWSSLQAQFVLEGQITDHSGETVIGANIIEQATTNGTVSDFDGNFSLTLTDSLATIVISYTGFGSKVIKLDGTKKKLSIILEENSLALESVVVKASRSSSYSMEGAADKSSKTSHSSSYSMGRSTDKVSRTRSASPYTEVRRSSEIAKTRKGEFSPKSAKVETRTPPATEKGTELLDDSSEEENPGVQSGTLTAGEINDFQKWDLWEDIAAEDLNRWQQHWQIYPSERYSVQLITEDNNAVIDAMVSLKNGPQTIWQSRTDNTGKAELWANLYNDKKIEKEYSIQVNYKGVKYEIKKALDFKKGINLLQLPVVCSSKSKQIDIAFVVDATGSMGDEIRYLKVELNDIIERTKQNSPDIAIQLGTVFYKDEGDSESYLTLKSPFSKDISQTTDFIKAQRAGGGGDFPEAVDAALSTAIDSMAWSEDAIGRFLFLVLDAPPHHNPKVLKRLKELTKKAAAKGIRIIPVTGSGIDKSTEYLMRTFSLMTNGTYVFLTDHSGVGNAHIEPTTDTYDVEKLNDLLVRLIYQYTYLPDCSNNDLRQLDVPKKVENSDTGSNPKLSWTYFPNPTSGQLRVKIKGKLEQFFLTDFSGKILQRCTMSKKNTLNLDIGQYPSGIYFLMAINANETLKGKVILAH